MKSRAIISAVALALGFGSLAQAQIAPPPDYSAPHWVPGPQDQDQRNPQSYDTPQGWQGYRQYGYGEAHPYPYDSRQYPGEWRGRHHYYRGGYVPDQYRSQRYWVRDWRARHLTQPPQGYQWVETDGGDVLLIALATGLIANVLLSQR